MPAIITRRDDGHPPSTHENNTMTHLLIVLVVLVSFGLALGGSLFFIRRIRRGRKVAGALPSYEASNKNHRGLTISTRDSVLVCSEKQHLIDTSSPMPLTPESIPEIRITFPEEEDKQGRRVSGRVVVVEVGEAGVGFVRPLENDGLPPYQQKLEERFASVDLDRIGGLKEKETAP
ncbi:unnamed protein product [Tuber melanosporum]|uniref:(Perigord truffle) hypothetical protein n=1 Tax=Tuber melanosporum (strain Mel28) TaxID=656061 RepID=D5GDF9_TUBMM|nr:uncharacterized protein GSTUM_00006194001 [Tuber melanosporum]CAZ82552.1 unnamed protein product [Tuber melanosporum]